MAGTPQKFVDSGAESPVAVIVVCLILIDQQGFMLATQRPPGKKLALFWEFPGGKVEGSESPYDALVREIGEELCLRLESAEPLQPVHHRYDFGTIELLPFISQCHTRPTIRLIEHQASVWVRPEDVGRLRWAPADIPVIAQVNHWISENA